MKRNDFIKRATLASIGLTLFPSIAFSDNSYEAYLRWFKNEFKHFDYDEIRPDNRYHNIRLDDDMKFFRSEAKMVVDYFEKGIKPHDKWLVKNEDNHSYYTSYIDILSENKERALRNHKKILRDYKIITFEEWKNR